MPKIKIKLFYCKLPKPALKFATNIKISETRPLQPSDNLYFNSRKTNGHLNISHWLGIGIPVFLEENLKWKASSAKSTRS
jgi:hypothetical protein